MGTWRRGKRTIRISFGKGHEFEGLWFKVGGMSVAEYIETDTINMAVVEAFGERLLEMNAGDPDTDDDTPMPATIASLGKLDADVVLSAALAWFREVARVHPLARRTTTEAPETEDPLAGVPMDVAG